MDHEERDHLQALRQSHLRRLRVLEEQAALSGKDTRAEIQIEIEDLKLQIAQLDQQLGAATAEPITFPSSRIFQIPHRRNPNFTGREDLLAALCAALTSGQPAALTQAIYGLGGIGKTQLAVEYAYRHAPEYSLVWWVRAEEPTTLAADYARLAQRLNLRERTASEQAIVVDAVRAWLEQRPDWLLILDNATDLTSIEPYLPRSSTGHILITSRYPDWGEIAAPLQVAVLPNNEAIALLLKRTGQTDRLAAEQIVNLVGALPLALAQAGSYIAETSCSLADYVLLFRAHQAELLAQGWSMQYSATVTTTWSLALTQVRQQTPVAADVLSLCKFLASDGIPLDLLRTTKVQLPESLAAVAADELALNQAIAALRRYSLVERTSDALSVHRLVQAIGREQLASEKRQAWAELAVQLVDVAFPNDSDDVRTWAKCARLLPHALAATAHAEQLQVATTTAARLLNNVGRYLRGRAEFTAAKAVHERALAISEATYGPDHPIVATCCNNLAMVLQDLGDLSAAKAHLERALAIHEATLGPDHHEVGTNLNNLALVLQDLGDLEGAKAHLERVLAMDEATSGPDHHEVGTDLNNLALVLKDLGDLEGAKAHVERALAIHEAAFGPDHPAVATCRNNLALVLRDLGDLLVAKAHLERALAIDEAAFDPDHPTVATRLNNLALVLQDLGDLEGAKAHVERALAIDEATLGPNHPNTVLHRTNLSRVEQQLQA
jgi:tetratricopeptide (TPR) repeat protein